MADPRHSPTIEIQRLRIVNATGGPIDATALARGIEGGLAGLSAPAGELPSRLRLSAEAPSLAPPGIGEAVGGVAARALSGGGHAR